MNLLTADLHLTDNPNEEYRWAVFSELAEAFDNYGPCDIFILGDLCDKKDRHSAALVNRLVESLRDLYLHMQDRPKEDGLFHEIHIIMGNHDAPLKGAPFWSFFDHIEGVNFYTEPVEVGEALLLPFTPNPAEAWADLDLDAYRCFMLHQPLEGARGANGRALAKGSPMPKLPRGVPAWAGDIHGPQKVGSIEYVGSPHPVAFDENHGFRLILLDDDYKLKKVIPVAPMRRHIIDLNSDKIVDSMLGDGLPELRAVRAGDQVKIRFHMPLNEMKHWPSTKAAIEAWAARDQIRIFSLEPIVEAGAEEGSEITPGQGMAEEPTAVLKEWLSEQPEVKGGLRKMGRRLLAQALEKN